MKRIILYLFISYASVAISEVNQNNDVQLWLVGDFQKKLSKRVILDITNEYRFGDNMSELYLSYLQGIFSFQWNPWLKTEPGYRQLWVKPPLQNSFRLIYEPLMNFTFSKPNRWDVRQRISYLIAESAQNQWLYRARIRLLSTLSPIYPYVSNEFFILTKKGLVQNRIQIGIHPKLYQFLSSDLFYIFRLAKESKWNNHHIFGFKFIIKF